jgi:methylated-DNA-[protein]-cysteine S-methyltransferase
MFAYALFDTDIGRCGLAWGPRGVLGVQLPEKSEMTTRMRLLRHCPNADEADPPKTIARGIEDIQALLAGSKKTLRAITPGTTRTYGDIARAIGDASSARAVGQALSRNPFAIVVPCHRVVGADFKLVGFSATGGIATKLKLLQIEGWRAAEPMLFDGLA